MNGSVTGKIHRLFTPLSVMTSRQYTARMTSAVKRNNFISISRKQHFVEPIFGAACSKLAMARCNQSTSFGSDGHDGDDDNAFVADELASNLAIEQDPDENAEIGTPSEPLAERLGRGAGSDGDIEIKLERLERAPAKFELMRNTSVYRWRTVAKHGRKLMGPVREWAEELQCRTGIHVEMDALDLDRANRGEYDSSDDVEVDVLFFGPDRAVTGSVPLMQAMLKLDPAHVRLACFRINPNNEQVEWLMLRRINKNMRPADIPPISLKTPGKYTMLFENTSEAAVRTLYEETGIDVDRNDITKTNVFQKPPVPFFWRPPVHYFIVEVPFDVEVRGPQTALESYLLDWDNRVLRMSKDPIDRVWATHADPKTGCAWLTADVIDELQKPVKMEDTYMATRYTPSPASGLQDKVKLKVD